MIRDILFTPYYIYRGHAESVETTGATARAVLHQEPTPIAPAATVCATLFDARAPIATPIITLGDKKLFRNIWQLSEKAVILHSVTYSDNL